MNTPFDTWFAKQRAEGLVDIKFAIQPGKGVSLEAIQNELLISEAAIQMGVVKRAPKAISMVPDRISQFMASQN